MEDGSNKIVWIIIIIINVIIYGVCCFLILRRKNFTAISIRSPTLLLSSIVSNFIMNLVIILHKIVNSNFISIFYYIFRLMLTFSFFLKFERILICFRYNKDKFNTNENMEKFADKRYLLQEKFYVKIFIGFFGVIFLSILIIELIGVVCFELFYGSFNINMDNYRAQMYFWIILNFWKMLHL